MKILLSPKIPPCTSSDSSTWTVVKFVASTPLPNIERCDTKLYLYALRRILGSRKGPIVYFEFSLPRDQSQDPAVPMSVAFVSFIIWDNTHGASRNFQSHGRLRISLSFFIGCPIVSWKVFLSRGNRRSNHLALPLVHSSAINSCVVGEKVAETWWSYRIFSCFAYASFKHLEWSLNIVSDAVVSSFIEVLFWRA